VQEIIFWELVCPQAGEMVMSCQLNDDAVAELLNKLKVGECRQLSPHLEGFIARASVDMTANDELSGTFLAKLFLQPEHLIVASIASLEVFFFLTVEV